MAKNRKAATATKKGRTKVRKLPVGEKELTAGEAKNVKGGKGGSAGSGIGTEALIAIIAGGGAAKQILAPELLVKK